MSEREVGELSSGLRNALRTRGVDAETAEDVVQEAWLRTLRTPPASRDPRRLAGWLRVVGLRLVAELRRSRAHRAEREHATARAEGVSGGVDECSDSLLVRRLLELPEPYREVVRLRFLEDLEVDEIAARLARPAVTVRSQLARGLDRLRQRLPGADARRRSPAWFVLLVERARRLLARPALAGAAVLGAGVVALLVAVAWQRERPTEARAHEVAAAASADERAPASAGERRAVELGAPAAGARATAPDAPGAPGALGRALDGRVTAPGGAPAAFATLFAGGRLGEGEPVGAADVNGAFAVALRADQRFLWATGDGGAPSRRVFVPALAGDAPHELVLAPSRGMLDLVVRAPDGTPAAGVAVELDGERGRAPSSAIAASGALELPFAGAAHGTTDAHGRVVLPKPARATVGLRVRDGGRLVLDQVLELPEGDETRVLALPSLARVSGVVLDALGRPAAGARVTVRQLDAARLEVMTADALGRFELDGLAPGAVGVNAEHAGGSGYVQVEADAGEHVEARLTVKRELALAGRALDDTGAPLAGARVTVFRVRQPGLPPDAVLTTDADGRFQVGALPGTEYALELALADAALPCSWLAPVRTGAPVELRPDPRLAERVPLVVELDGPEPGRAPTLVVLRTSEPRLAFELPVDPATRRVTADVPPLAYELVAWVPGIGAWRAPGRLTPGNAPVRVALPRPALVELAVTGPADAEVEAHLELGGFVPFGFDMSDSLGAHACVRELAADAGGRRFAAEVFPGRYPWTVRAGGHLGEQGEVRASAGERVALAAAVVPAREVELALVAPPNAALDELELIAETPAGPRVLPRSAELPRAEGWRVLALPVDATALHARSASLAGSVAIDPGTLAPDGARLRLTLSLAPGERGADQPPSNR